MQTEEEVDEEEEVEEQQQQQLNRLQNVLTGEEEEDFMFAFFKQFPVVFLFLFVLRRTR